MGWEDNAKAVVITDVIRVTWLQVDQLCIKGEPVSGDHAFLKARIRPIPQRFGNIPGLYF
jgi:hypothetical protein